jgi:hypothetical protein
MLFNGKEIINAPLLRKPSLPCAVGRYCSKASCNRRTYELTKAQEDKLLKLAGLYLDVDFVPTLCDTKGCRKRRYRTTIARSFCIKAKCRNLKVEKHERTFLLTDHHSTKTITQIAYSCKLAPKKKAGRLSFVRHPTTLRRRDASSGWWYRRVE